MILIRRFSLLLAVLLLAGCARPVVVRNASLPLPPRPVLQPVPASSVQCLSDATYSALVRRERALRTWGLKLEAIIASNNRGAPDTGK